MPLLDKAGGGQAVDPGLHHDVQDQQVGFIIVCKAHGLLGCPQPRQQPVAACGADIHFEKAPGDILVVRHDDPDAFIHSRHRS